MLSLFLYDFVENFKRHRLIEKNVETTKKAVIYGASVMLESSGRFNDAIALSYLKSV